MHGAENSVGSRLQGQMGVARKATGGWAAEQRQQL